MNTEIMATELWDQVGYTWKEGAHGRIPMGWPAGTRDFRVTLTYQGRRMSCDFFQGPAVLGPPLLLHVLDSLFSDASLALDSFEEFCREGGYKEDSRKDFAIWRAVVRQTKRLVRLFGEDFEEMRDLVENRNEA